MRIVSLVPSLTETLLAMAARGRTSVELAGRTAYCIHPSPLIESVPVVGGTKTPKLDRIVQMRPDLVLLDREENPLRAYEVLRDAGVATFVSEVTDAIQVPGMLRDLGRATGLEREGGDLASKTEAALDAVEAAALLRPGKLRAIPLIWHRPLMALSARRYGGSLVVRGGMAIPLPSGAGAYPAVTPADLAAADADALLLTSEPHDFTPSEGEEIADSVAAAGGRRPRPVKIDGELLTWFGARTGEALRYFAALANRLGGGRPPPELQGETGTSGPPSW